MSILEIKDLKFSYGDKNLFNSLQMRLFPNDHLGLIGANGVGKTTLMKLMAHRLDPDEGKVVWREGVTYSYLDQHLQVDSSLTIAQYLYDVYTDLFAMEEQMNKYYDSLVDADPSQYDKILKSAEFLQTTLEEKGFYLIKSKIANVLNGLGISYEVSWPMMQLSSGQRVKVFLAKMLLEEKDILLLDEPTNFLDSIHVDWLAKYLNSYKKAFVVISHNLDFIKAIANVVVEITNKKVEIYKGDYQSYLVQKKLREDLYKTQYEAQQKYIKKTQEFIDKNIVRASTTKRAQSRRKALEKIDVLEKPLMQKRITFSFPFTNAYHMEALTTKKLVIGYTHPLLPALSLKIRFGEKIAIVGKNGVGKTTFLKTILAQIPCLAGEFWLNPLNKITYYSQEILTDKTKTAVQYIQDDYPLMDDGMIRNLLSQFGIIGELAVKEMNKLSGGEQTKVRFAKLSLEKSNMLILDEPTNHLDRQAKDSLFKALALYPGTVLLVTHERSFYRHLKMKEIIFG
ncbi:MAG TPA: ABC-F family ATP-binding cassette domain-containing protein [Bacilli bacterium]|nr:MAG: putative ABC transporter ATP-binding protein YheS [Tenericutes bacterium ADurb.BinA124]HPX84612.1 ABC-F family ATP-binding cassette domain-containing protein [Bacilli bacterium]HQC74818.1 ABC-F family ATP-binding cassette domain-containing protein [Bacilli bacterium]